VWRRQPVLDDKQSDESIMAIMERWQNTQLRYKSQLQRWQRFGLQLMTDVISEEGTRSAILTQ